MRQEFFIHFLDKENNENNEENSRLSKGLRPCFKIVRSYTETTLFVIQIRIKHKRTLTLSPTLKGTHVYMSYDIWSAVKGKFNIVRAFSKLEHEYP